jgi:hypothetical protein
VATLFEYRVTEQQLDISLHEPGDLPGVLPSSEEDQIVANAVAEVREVGAFTDDVSEAASRVAAEPAAGEGRTIDRVRNSFILPMPAEVPEMPDLPTSAGDTSLTERPDPRRESSRCALPEGGRPTEGPRAIPVGEVGR